MSQGTSRAKKAARSSRNDRLGRNAYRKASLPAKAGKRKVYGKGSKRKVKPIPDGSNGFHMKQRGDNYPWPRDMGYTLNPVQRKGDPVWSVV